MFLTQNQAVWHRFCDRWGRWDVLGWVLKKPNFFGLLFHFFGFFFAYSQIKNRSIKSQSTYVYIYLIYVEGSPQCRGIFFFAGGTSSWVWQVRKFIPTIAVPRFFLCGGMSPSTVGSQGKAIHMIAMPRFCF